MRVCTAIITVGTHMAVQSASYLNVGKTYTKMLTAIFIMEL
jgi:hypothetical protein